MAKIDDTRARELYEQGLNDREIGEQFGASGNAVHQWRRKRGLPSHNPPGKRSYAKPKTQEVKPMQTETIIATVPANTVQPTQPNAVDTAVLVPEPVQPAGALPALTAIAQRIRATGIPYGKALDVLALLLPAIELLEDTP